MTYRWKVLDESYNFASDLISIGSLHTKLWGPQVAGVPTLGISGLPFGSLGTKCHLDVGLVERHIVYYKGEGGDLPQVQVVVNLVSLNLPNGSSYHQKCSNYTLTNLLFGFVQVSVSD